MKQKNDIWMAKIKERLRDYSEEPAPNGWDMLEKELGATKKNTSFILNSNVCRIAAVALLLLIGGATFYFLLNNSHHSAPSIDDIALLCDPDEMPQIAQSEKGTVTVKESGSVRAHNIRNILAKAPKAHTVLDSSQVEVPDAAKQHEETLSDNVIPEERVPDEQKEPILETDGNNEGKTSHLARPSGKDKLHLPVSRNKSVGKKWSLATSVGALPDASSTVEASTFKTTSGNISNSFFTLEGAVPDFRLFENYEMEHKQPLSFGLTFRKSLTNNFAIESGIVYTLLASDVKKSSSKKQIEQKLHYIGIPIRGVFGIWNHGQFQLYASGGGMVEKCIYGEFDGKKNTVGQLQFSLLGGVGVQYKISNRVGLYFEPGISYYFNDGSNVQTIRKEKQLNFNLQGGIRLTY